MRAAYEPNDPDRVNRMREALVEPLRNVYGVADKVLTMTLSMVLLAADNERLAWHEVGASLIAIDTLVHTDCGPDVATRCVLRRLPLGLPDLITKTVSAQVG